MIDSALLTILVCPICKSKLALCDNQHSLVCRIDRLRFPIVDGVPIMLESEASPIEQSVET